MPNVIPDSWLDNAKVFRVVTHWTAGAYACSSLDKSHYHFLIDGDGEVHNGYYSPKDNEDTSDGRYAAHTWGLNTGSVGVAVCCMAGASRASAGHYPMRRIQWDTMVNVVAQIARHYRLAVNERTVLGHFEVTDTYGIDQEGKWDPGMWPWNSSVSPDKVGDAFRDSVRKAMETSDPSPTKEEHGSGTAALFLGQKHLTSVKALLSNGSMWVPLREVAKTYGWEIVKADGKSAVLDICPRSTFDYLITVPITMKLSQVDGYAELRPLAEALGSAKVTWVHQDNTAVFTVVKTC